MVGRELRRGAPARPATPPARWCWRSRAGAGPPRARGWRRGRRRRRFDVRAGEILGIAGLLGAGRTEIARDARSASAAGERAGEIRLGGEPVGDRARRRTRCGAGIALVTEDRKRDGLVLDAADRRANIALPLLGPAGRGSAWCAPAREAALARDDGRSGSAIRCTRHRAGGRGTLSGGNQQKVVHRQVAGDGPARAAARRADARHRRRRQARDLRADRRAGARRGSAIVLVSSELPELLRLADRILVMCEGGQTGHARARRGDAGADHAACGAGRRRARASAA